MRLIKKLISMFAAVICVGPAACDRSEPQPANTMTTEEIILQNANAPIGKSIVPVTSSLAKHTIFVATESSPSTQPTMVKLDVLRLRTAQDKEGQIWVYAYTTQAQMLKTFPQGSPYVELDFNDFFRIIEKDPKFGGVFLNSSSTTPYPIPRAMFEDVKAVLH